jgi:hypothetical protein
MSSLPMYYGGGITKMHFIKIRPKSPVRVQDKIACYEGWGNVTLTLTKSFKIRTRPIRSGATNRSRAYPPRIFKAPCKF